MKKPITSLPFAVGDKGFITNNNELEYYTEVISTNPESPYKYLTNVISDPDPSPEDVHAQINDAEYIVEACNKYPLFIEFLEQIESKSECQTTCKKIREFMNKQELW